MRPNHLLRTVLLLLLVLSLSGLTACGKRPRNVDPPPGSEDVIYPKRYPPPDSPDSHL